MNLKRFEAGSFCAMTFWKEPDLERATDSLYLSFCNFVVNTALIREYFKTCQTSIMEFFGEVGNG